MGYYRRAFAMATRVRALSNLARDYPELLGPAKRLLSGPDLARLGPADTCGPAGPPQLAASPGAVAELFFLHGPRHKFCADQIAVDPRQLATPIG